MRTRSIAVALATLLALTLTACGGTSAPDLPSLDAGGDAKPATGDVVEGLGYSFKLVPDWKQSTDKQGQDVDTIAFAASPVDGFTPNVNVGVKIGAAKGDLTSADFKTAEQQVVDALESVGSTDVQVQPRLNLDGETALHITSNAKQGEVEYLTNQYVAFRKGTQFVVTFSFPVSFQESQYLDVTGPVMASWAWS